MEITYPFAKVFTDSTNKLNIFFLHDDEHSMFQQIGDIGTGIVDFCELNFSDAVEKIQALEFCLSNEVLPEYTLPERYVMFCNLYPDFTHHILRSMYGVAPVANGRFDTSKLISFNDPGEVDTREALRNIHRDSNHTVSMWQYFAIQSLEKMLYLELMEMVKRGIRIKCCSLCDRYFVLSDKRKRDYCDRIYKNNRTCKQIGAKQKFNQSVEQDSFLQEFQRIYNRMYSRYYRMDAWDSNQQTNKLTEKEFKAWADMASKARLEYKLGEISGEDLIKRISENKE